MKDNNIYSNIFKKLSFNINIKPKFVLFLYKMIKYLLILLFPFFTYGQAIIKEFEDLINKKEYTKAETVLTSYINTNPNETRALELSGDSYALQNEWEEAALIFEQLIQVDAKNANYHYKYGEALGMKALRNNAFFSFFMMNKVKGEFLLAANLDNTHIDSRWALVVYYTELPGIIGGSIRKALEFTDQLQILSPVDGYLSKGYVYEYDNEVELAEENYKKAIEVGGSINCYNKLISFYKKNNEPEKAISIIEEAYIKLKINTLNYQLGEVSATFNLNLEKGGYSLNKYIKNFSSEDEYSIRWAYLRLAQIYKHKEDKFNALKWINKALSIQSEFELALKEKKLILNM